MSELKPMPTSGLAIKPTMSQGTINTYMKQDDSATQILTNGDLYPLLIPNTEIDIQKHNFNNRSMEDIRMSYESGKASSTNIISVMDKNILPATLRSRVMNLPIPLNGNPIVLDMRNSTLQTMSVDPGTGSLPSVDYNPESVKIFALEEKKA